MGQQAGQEGGEVDGQAGLPGRTAVGVVLGRQPVKDAVDLAELPFDMNLALAEVVTFEADGLPPAQAGVADRDDQGEVVVPAGQQRGAFGEQ